MALTKVKGAVSPFVAGMTMPWPGPINTIPDGWIHVNNQELKIADYEDLYAAIGKTWGGTGTTFKLPPADRFLICAGSSYPVGNVGGAVTKTTTTTGAHSHTVSVGNTTLTLSQIPSHLHASAVRVELDGDGESWQNINGYRDFNDGRVMGAANGFYDAKQPFTTSSGTSGSHNHSASSGSAGNHSHTVDVRPPYFAMVFMIKL